MADKGNWMNGNGRNKAGADAEPVYYGGKFFEICVKGQLNSHWSEWLEGLEVKLIENGEMILSGPIVDQAALMGVLNKLSHLNLTLLSVNEMKKTNRSEAK